MRLDHIDRARAGLRAAPRDLTPPRLLGAAGVATLIAGLVAWALGAGFAALWLFGVAAVCAGLALPLPYAVVSPLFIGVVGWLVDMLPFVILLGWAAVVLRWAAGVVKDRRLPRGGRWIWLPVGLAAWTVFGIISVPSIELKHFVLLFGLQGLASGVLLVVVDQLGGFEDRLKVITSLIVFVLVLSAGVLLQFVGIPVQSLQDETISTRVEDAYGLDAFPNNLEMIKYGLSSKAGAREFRNRMETFASQHPELPAAEVFLPKFRAFENHIVIKFAGSARSFESELNDVGVQLVYDNIGLTPANTIPRMRSFARNSLTYAGVCVVLFPLSFFIAWTGKDRRRRLLGWAGVVACLFGSGFSLVRGSWIAILIGIAYLFVDGPVVRRRKREVAIAFLAAALMLTAFFVARYEVDPLGARALGQGSVTTRASVYEDTVESLTGIQVLFGFGTERPRTEEGTSHVSNRYVPDVGTHSTYLNYLFRTGVPGALGVVALYGIAWLHARAAASTGVERDRLFAAMLAVAIFAGAAHAVILNLFTEPIYTLTVCLLLGLAMAGATELRNSVLPWRKSPAAG